jgi:hypothetical protein
MPSDEEAIRHATWRAKNDPRIKGALADRRAAAAGGTSKKGGC